MRLKVLAATVLLAAPAFAGDGRYHPVDEKTWDALKQPGWYAEAAGQFLLEAFDVTSSVSPKGGGLLAAAGYRFNAWYSLQTELHWGMMTGRRSSGGAGVTTSGEQRVQTGSAMLSGKLYPFASTGLRFQPYVKVGGGYLVAKADSTLVVQLCGTCPAVTTKTSARDGGFALKWGGGADIHVAERLYLFVDYAFVQSITEAIDAFDYHAIGAGVGVRW